MQTTKLNKRTMPKRKPTKVAKNSKSLVAKAAKKAKVKVKPKFNLKGIPAKYKLICNLAIEHAQTQEQCYELLLVGVNAYEELLENDTPENAEKLKSAIVTKAILTRKETFPEIVIEPSDLEDDNTEIIEL